MEKELKNSLNWKEIGQRFRELRESKGCTQSEITSISSNPKNISQFENGSAPASTNYALFLRNEFGASFDWLYDGDVIEREYEDIQTKKILDAHTIGARLKAVRKEKGMTQVEFGKMLGVSRPSVSLYESGTNIPEIKTALKIKRALNKNLDWIYFGDRCIGTKARITKPTTTKSTMPLKQLKKELKEEAMSYIKVMNESELAMLTTRLRMEQKHHATLSTSTTQDTQLNSRSHQKKQKSSK